MMKKFILIALSITFITGFDEVERKIEEGTYTGKFKVVYPSGKSCTGKTTIELSHSTYTCTGNEKRFPAGGSGTYSIDNESKITFQDENMWAADFDWNLILTGEYHYSFDGKKLKLSANKAGIGYYEYRLTKK